MAWLFLLVVSVSSLALGEELIITQDLANCPDNGQFCSTLNEQISSSHVLSSNSIVRFTAGTHSIFEDPNGVSFVVRDIHNLTLLGEGNVPSEILCSHLMKFVFINISALTISNLSFLNCSAPFTEELLNETILLAPQLVVEESFQFTPTQQVAIFLYNIVDLELSHVSVRNSTGFGLLGINVLGDSLVANCDFSFNNFLHYQQQTPCFTPSPKKNSLECAGGGFVLGYVDTPTCDLAHEPQMLSITSSCFSYNLNLLYSGFGGGLVVVLAQSYYGVSVYLDNVTSEGNLAALNANIALLQYSFTENSSFTMRNSISKDSNSLLDSSAFFLLGTYDYTGGGFGFFCGLALPPDSRTCPRLPRVKGSSPKDTVLFVSNSSFVSNQATVGAGANILVSLPQKDGFLSLNLIFENCYFGRNTGSPGSALTLYEIPSLQTGVSASYEFRSCTFEQNSFPHIFGDLNLDAEPDIFNTIFINTADNVAFENCQFSENKGTALYVYNTKVKFLGNSTFEGNIGSHGGGLALHASSTMILMPETSITFAGNIAEKGGAIFVSNKNYRTRQLCFWQIYIRNDSVLQGNISAALNIQLKFSENEARDAGSILFGGSIDWCFLTAVLDYPNYNSTTVFEDLFVIESSKPNVSLISSVPSRVCICSGGEPLCKNLTIETSIFPGETIGIPLITVGQRDSPSPGIINAILRSSHSHEDDRVHSHYLEVDSTSLETGQETQVSQGVCTEMKYTIFSTQKTLTLEFTTDNDILEDQTTHVQIELKDCPLGFNLTTDGTKCDCISFLLERDLECDIQTRTIQRRPPVWIGNHSLEGISFYPYCPFDYCLPDSVNITIPEQDRQCAYNRSGVLCGQCAPGYSVIFGGNECWKCSNSYLLLIVVYAVAGLLLIFFLYTFDTLTVSAGTINGLIFYANIVQINRAVFFPPEHENPFIAWLSLDFGIRACFYDGMDMYAKAWLQFVFPLYIVLILVCVIVVTSYSTSASKILGKKSVGVLATFFLLFFSRIQRIIISCVAFATLRHSTGSTTLVWRFDGNVPYLEGKQAALFLVGIILTVIVLTFNFVLLFGKQFQALSSYRFFRWVNKLKPLFDAFMGPYRDRFRCWTGLLLLVRAILILLNIIVDQPERILLATAIVVQLLSTVSWFSGGIYRKWPLNVLEFSFLLNLAITSTATLFVRSLGNEPEYQSAVIYTSVSIAILEFVVIFLHALYLKIVKASCKSLNFVKFQQGLITLRSRLSRVLEFSQNTRNKKAKSDLKKQASRPSIQSVQSCTSTVVELNVRPDGEFAEQSVIVLREPILENS